MGRTPASDSFIGRLFRRIKPGTSYAAFPWRSWDKICTILETIRGRGIRVVRSTNDTAWELDATANLDKPHAYSVYVHDPENEVGPYGTADSAGTDDERVGATIPPVMANDTKRSAYCYVPYFVDGNNIISGANGPDGAGRVGARADEEWPVGSHWGWKRVGEVDTDDPLVVYGVLSPGADSTSPKFDNIQIAAESDFMADMRANTPDASAVPIAWINGSNVVQTLCGRPWQNGNGNAVIGIVKTVSVGDNEDSVIVTLYPNGTASAPGEDVKLHTPVVFRRCPFIEQDAVLCFPCSVGVTGDGEEA